MNWFIKEQLNLRVNLWKNKHFKSIGPFIHRNPTVTWKSDMDLEMRNCLKKTLREENEENNAGIKVPKFLLFHEKKSFGTGSLRKALTVIHVQCRK